jgi:hypothetical protein
MQGNQPLYNRVPARDEDGKPLSDFMILVSGFRSWPGARQAEAVTKMRMVLGGFREVLFADLNVPLNLLWVSVKARHGVIADIYSEFQCRIPEARIVGPYTP